MKLFYAPGTCALAPHIALIWTKANYETEAVKLGSAELLKINPSGMVPAMKLEGKPILTQADAILKYIAETHKDANLLIEGDAYAHYELDEMLAFLTGDFHPAFWPFFTPARYTVSKDEAELEAVKTASYARIDKVLSYLDKRLEGQDYLVRNQRTIADPYAFVMARWSEYLPKTWKEYPNLARFMNAMYEDEGVKRAMREQGLIE